MTIKKSTPNEDFVDALSNPEVIGPQHNHHHHQSHRPNPHLDKLKTQRKHEKERLRGLNVKLEAYLEKIKNLERQNDTLIELIGELKHRLLSDSDTVKHDFELPLNILKKNLNAEAGHELTAKLKMRRVKYLMEVTRLKLVELANESRQNAAKIEQLKSYRDSLNQEKQSLLQKFDHLNASMEKHRGKTDELNFKLQRVHDELDRQILERVRVESERQRLIEEIEFNKSVNTLFKDETQRVARSAVNKSSLDETYYSGELRSSISKMRDDFGKLAEENRTQLLAFYQSKLDKYESELKNRESVSAVDDHKRAQEVHILKTFDDRFRKDIDYLSAVNTALENKYNELWQKLDALRSHNQKELRERENLIEYLKHQLMESLAEKGLEPSDIKPEFKIFEKLLDLSSNCISRKQQVNTNQTNVRQESQVKSTNDRLVPVYLFKLTELQQHFSTKSIKLRDKINIHQIIFF